MPTILIIFGVTGDLAKKKLLPAIAALKDAGRLPAKFEVVGVSRKESGYFFQMDVENPAEYARLAEQVEKIEEKFGEEAQRLYYLAVPPAASSTIIANLGTAGLLEEPMHKLLIEKPFGTDLASAEAAILEVAKYAPEEQVYRVDHYLAKAIADRLLEAKKSEAWNSETVARIDIIATETIGIEGRAEFYEQVGVLGDVIQSHLMELLALALMELPEEPQEISGARCAALVQLAPVAPGDAKRAQYEGYREEAKSPASIVPTFASLTLHSTDPTWANVPLSITAGKGVAEKRTEVRVEHRDGYVEVLSAEPDTFPSGYAQVLLSAMAGEHGRFASSCEVLASWHALDGLMHAWRTNPDGPIGYEKDSSPLQ